MTDTTREAFEAWYFGDAIAKAKEIGSAGNYKFISAQNHWEAWQAATERATQVERERCAALCERESQSHGGIAEGPFVTDFGKHTHQSMAAGAHNCAAAIRQGDDT